MNSQARKKEVSGAAKMATFSRQPQSENAKRFVQDVLGRALVHESENDLRERRRRPSDAQSFELALGAYLAEMLLHDSYTASEGYFYRSKDKVELAKTYVKFAAFEQISEILNGLGYLEVQSGYHVRDRFDADGPENISLFGYAGRYRGTESFFELAATYGLFSSNCGEHFPVSKDDEASLVICKTRRTKESGSGAIGMHGAKYENALAEVKRINTILDAHQFSLFDKPRVRRVFNNADDPLFDFNMGGRLYCHSADDWQNNKERRRSVAIDGFPVVEVDIKACYPTILCGMTGYHFAPGRDPYDVEGIERDVVKLYVSTRIGSGKRPSRWPSKHVSDYRTKTGKELGKVYPLRKIHALLEDTFPPILGIEEGVLDWAVLQFQESEILNATLLELGEKRNIAALPVYDCLVVANVHAEETMEVLEQCFEQRLGIKPFLSIKKA